MSAAASVIDERNPFWDYLNSRAKSSARDFFLITNQKSEKPPTEAVTVEAVTMAEMPPPDIGSLGIISPHLSCVTAAPL